MESEIVISDANRDKLLWLRNKCIQILNEVAMDELRKKNNGKDPEYFPYVAAHYSLYIKFATLLLNNLDEGLKMLDDRIAKEEEEKK